MMLAKHCNRKRALQVRSLALLQNLNLRNTVFCLKFAERFTKECRALAINCSILFSIPKGGV